MIYSEKEICGLRYVEALPENFDKNKKYPLILSIHGAGTRGSDISLLYESELLEYANKNSDFPFIVIAPLGEEDTWFESYERLVNFTKTVAAFPFVDSERVYLTGASMGGYITWQLAMTLPQYFAAIVPICGGGMYWNAGRLKNVPVWAFHGALDKVVLPEETVKMVTTVNLNGGDAKITIYPHNDHNAWTDTYNNPDVYEWLLSHKNENKTELKNIYADAKKFG